MHSPPRIFFKQFPEKSACTYYRVEIPQRFMWGSGGWDMAIRELPEILTGDDMVSYLTEMMNNDVIHCYATGGTFGVKLQRLLNKLPCEELPNGTIVTPPAFIVDLDDNVDYVHPLNPRFSVLGTRLPGVGPLTPGEDVRIVLPTGETVPVWEDLKTRDPRGRLFDIKKNQDGVRKMNTVLRRAQGTSFTTERLRDYYVREHGLRNTYVFPNSVIEADYPKINLVRDPGFVKVLWQGGDSHYPDWHLIRDGVKLAIEKFPEIKWIIWGARFPWIHDLLPRDRTEFVEWTPYQAYKVRLATLDFDIALAPLVDNIFNEGKSCIKWYEASVLLDPKPVLASNCPPYSDEIQDGVNGMLFSSTEEFIQKLEVLVRSKEARDNMARAAHDWIIENRGAHKTVPLYGKWLYDTASRYSERRRQRHLRGVQAKTIRDAR